MSLQDIIAGIFLIVSSYFLKQGLSRVLCEFDNLACFYGFILYYLIPFIILVSTIIYWHRRISPYIINRIKWVRSQFC